MHASEGWDGVGSSLSDPSPLHQSVTHPVQKGGTLCTWTYKFIDPFMSIWELKLEYSTQDSIHENKLRKAQDSPDGDVNGERNI
jgi:hypothetical protein